MLGVFFLQQLYATDYVEDKQEGRGNPGGNL